MHDSVDADAPSGIEVLANLFGKSVDEVAWTLERARQLMYDLALPLADAKMMLLEELQKNPWRNS